MSAPTSARDHARASQTYKDLPPLAGLCSMEQAVAPGLSVDEVVTRLKRFHYAFKRLHHLLTARITAEPVYELKTALSHHAYLCAEHTAALRKRVAEMREPPLGLSQVPHPALEVFFDEILCAPDSESLVVGVYGAALPALRAAMRKHIEQTHKLADAPSIRVCRFALLELNDMIAFGEKAITGLIDEAKRGALAPWKEMLDACLAAAGGLDGTTPSDETIPSRHFSAKPYDYDPVPKRDERFIDPYNAGVNAEAFLYDEKMPAFAKALMMYYKRIRELDVPEMMASFITQTPGKPWDYYLDMTRQLWDEARHAMMGEVGFVSVGIDWSAIPINFTWSLNLNTQLAPIERNAVLYFIEQGLMPKTGKRYEWEVGLASGQPLAGLFQDYDWADEVLHAAIGRKWYVAEIGDAKKAIAYGDESWSRVMVHWRKYREDGLTQHRNWWPEVYQQACANTGIAPDARALAFRETYETIRADLKEISASG